MVPRVDTTMCEDDETIADVLSTMRQTGFSRIPVYHEDPDNVAGIAHIKDPDSARARWKGRPAHRRLLRDATFVPDTKDILPLLSRCRPRTTRSWSSWMKYGGTAGIITIEDIVEGDRRRDRGDEFDPDNKSISRAFRAASGSSMGVFRAMTRLSLVWPLEESDDYETIAGWILELCDSVPDIGEVFEVAGCKFKVQSMRGQRISPHRAIAPARNR